VAEPGARRAVTALPFAAAVSAGACRARRPRADLHPGISRSNEPSRRLAGQLCGAMARELAIALELVRHGAALR
jgi:hypothetical protein